ncbi:MAG: hypothetical protein ACOX64_06970 [Candidatus Merdivicinus sp.]|jgi:hypothetical protein
MKRLEPLTYTEKIKWRIRVLWLTAIGMLVYMVIVGELGGGDSRMMTDFANAASDILFFGGLIFVFYRIVRNKRLLKSQMLLKEQLQMEEDERNQYLHDKSGGVVLDILLISLLFITITAALFNMAAFYTAAVILALAIFLKIVAYFFFSRI